MKPVFRLRTGSGRAVTITASAPAAHAAGLASGGRPRRRRRDRRAGDAAGVRRRRPVRRRARSARCRGDHPAARSTRRRSGSRHRRWPGSSAACSPAAGAVQRRRQASAGISFSAPSEALASQVSHALLRLGVRSVRRRHRCADGGARHDVEVTEPASVVRFADEVPVPALDAHLSGARTVAAASVRQRTPLPVEVWDDIDKARGDLPWPALNERLGRAPGDRWYAPRGRLTRERRRRTRHRPRRRAAAVVGLAGRRVGPHRRDHAARRDRGRRLHGPGPPQLRGRRPVPPQHGVRPRHGRPRRADDSQAGARVLARDGPQRADPAHPVERGQRRLVEDAQRAHQRGRLGAHRAGDRAPRGAAVPRRQPARDGHGDPRQGARG